MRGRHPRVRLIEESTDGQHGIYDIEGIRIEYTGSDVVGQETRVQVLLPPDPAPWQEVLYQELIRDMADYFGVTPQWGARN